MSPVNSMFVCIKKKKIIGKSVFKMADIGKMLHIGADNRSTPRKSRPVPLPEEWLPFPPTPVLLFFFFFFADNCQLQ